MMEAFFGSVTTEAFCELIHNFTGSQIIRGSLYCKLIIIYFFHVQSILSKLISVLFGHAKKRVISLMCSLPQEKRVNFYGREQNIMLLYLFI